MARAVFQSQLNNEKTGLVMPYLNFAQSPNQQAILMMIFPTLVFENRNKYPSFCITHLIPESEFKEEKYNTYANMLLETLTKPK